MSKYFIICQNRNERREKLKQKLRLEEEQKKQEQEQQKPHEPLKWLVITYESEAKEKELQRKEYNTLTEIMNDLKVCRSTIFKYRAKKEKNSSCYIITKIQK